MDKEREVRAEKKRDDVGAEESDDGKEMKVLLDFKFGQTGHCFFTKIT